LTRGSNDLSKLRHNLRRTYGLTNLENWGSRQLGSWEVFR